MDMTRAIGAIHNSKVVIDDELPMDMTIAFSAIHTPAPIPTTPESSPFYNSPISKSYIKDDAEITRSPLSTGIIGTPKRTPTRGLVALDLLTKNQFTPSARRKSDSGITLGSPRAATRLQTRKSIAGVEEFNTHDRRVSLGRESWRAKEFGGDFGQKLEEEGIRDMIAKMTPKKQKASPVKFETPRKMMTMGDDLMLTPGMMKREFGSKVANLVKVWEDKKDIMDEEDDFPMITLAEFLTMTNISFLDGLGTTARRRTFAPPEGLSSLQKPTLGDYAKAGAVSIPMLELYQFVPPSFFSAKLT